MINDIGCENVGQPGCLKQLPSGDDWNPIQPLKNIFLGMEPFSKPQFAGS